MTPDQCVIETRAYHCPICDETFSKPFTVMDASAEALVGERVVSMWCDGCYRKMFRTVRRRDGKRRALNAHVNTTHQPSSTVNEMQAKSGTDSE